MFYSYKYSKNIFETEEIKKYFKGLASKKKCNLKYLLSLYWTLCIIYTRL